MVNESKVYGGTALSSKSYSSYVFQEVQTVPWLFPCQTECVFWSVCEGPCLVYLWLPPAPKSVSANHILNCPSSKSGFLCVIWFSKTWNPSQRWWWCEEVWRWGLSNFCVKAGLPVGSCENPSQVIWLFFCTKQSLRVSRPPVRDMIRWL